VLEAMGMPLAFTSAADFTGMRTEGELHVDDVFHKTFVEVNEEGTEAAAATAVVVSKSATVAKDDIVYFAADRPFLFVLRDTTTGVVLFIGRVADPR
jgi:serpin B